ncbi:RNA polymerase sigma factor [Carboxylicivirga sp. M1479]|uniref:RNA polymerase sigma factor n=1 Tax=Carboxylicivirga sp. M1479 TaxID=2594476 RepID=UPI00163DA1B4|nr:RNA polymerase sigma factor [Carboxylicivirga sp. M1479]
MSESTNLTERIVEQCKRGDERAQHAIYKQYVRAMYNVAYRMVANQFDAEDVVQDAFVKAFKKVGNLKENKAFGAWLKQIVIHEAIGLIRKNKNKEIKLEWVDELPDSESDEPDNDLPMEQVMNAIIDLPQGARVVFTLRVVEGYKFAEIAQLTGLTENNCKVQFHRSKKLLNTKLKSILYVG